MMAVMARAVLAALLLACTAAATKIDPAPQGGNASGMSALDVRLKRLESELRCLVCQNQTLADSNADLADDLRREVRALALSGKSDEDIKAYLVARYGDFVLYNPPVKPVTWALWFGPFSLLVGGVVVWWVVLQRRLRAAASETTDTGRTNDEKARKLLDDDND
jgi:cytochrome c-type biogenesis protein CcmH